MQKNMIRKADSYASQYRHRRIWRKVVGGLACVVVFCTTYALILPAITMEKTGCDIPEHTHTEECYTQVTAVTRQEPVCSLESLNLHEHTAECFDENGEPICGYSDFVVHEHDSACYDEDGNLWCPLLEIKAHTHDVECYTAAEPVHTHTEDCCTQERGGLICTEEEREGHTHSLEAGCFDENGTLVCEVKEAPGHQHRSECYSWEQALSCGLTEAEMAGEPELVCGKEEIILHEHSADCFDENDHLICGKRQVLEHVHDQACLQTAEEETVEDGVDTETLTCQLEENEEHQHGPRCYGTWELACGLQEHTHTEECTATAELTEEEQAQAQVDQVIALIDALPKMEEIQETLAAYDEAEDYDGYSGYLTEMQSRVLAVHAAYIALTDAQQEAVTNANQLLALMNGLALNETAAIDNEEIPEEILSALAKEYGIYPGTKQTPTEEGAEVWAAMNGEAEDSATVKATVTLSANSQPAENSYLYIREVTDKENAPYYPSDDTVKNVVGEYNAYQCYAIHWVQIYQADSVLEEGSRNKNDNVIGGDGSVTNSAGDVIGKVYKDGAGRTWVCIYGTESTLNEQGGKASVQIEYLNKSAYLAGEQAHRKLRIFNSRAADGQTLEENAMATGVTADTEAYTSFTFETNRGGPYVFVSQKVFEGYVSNLTISTTLDGTEPFDSDNDPGNDQGNNNGIVRSYDLITYNLTATLAARQAGITREDATLYLEMTMEADLTQASLDVSKMLWMDSYIIYYLNRDGNVLYWQDAKAYSAGEYYYLGSSAAAPTATTVRDCEAGVSINSASLNAILSHSTNGESSYTSQVVTQRLVGYAVMTAGSTSADHNVLAAQETLSAAIQVLNAKNGTSFQPTFRAWLQGNEANYGSESGDGNSVQLSPIVTENKVESTEITVSATAKFNLELAKNSNVTYRGWFDSANGVEVTENSKKEYDIDNKKVTGAQLYKLLEELAFLEENAGKANPEDFTDEGEKCTTDLNELQLSDYKGVFSHIRYGRITGYGLTLQVYNSATTSSDTAAKGFKGITLPQGDITFALDLTASIKNVDSASEVDETQYYAQLWEYNENENVRTNYSYKYDDPYIGDAGTVNIQGNDKGNQNRNMYWANLESTGYAAWSAVYNGLYVGKGDTVHGAYYGGNWGLNNGNGYSFTVSSYDFNFTSTGLIFPTIKAGDSNKTAGYNAYIGCFSAGQIQVLNVFPRRQTATVNMDTTVTAKNFTLKTIDGKEFGPSAGDSTGYAQETNKGDNFVNDSIPLYAPGRMTKANAFCTRLFFTQTDTANFSGTNYFLGTNFWNSGYDCSTFAGQDITLVGAARIGAGDYAIRSMNLLQLFDTKALSLDIENKPPYVVSTVANAVRGETTILYAADPDYPTGYDTNNKAVLEYMSTVREEDLIYYESLTDLEEAGCTCVGVLAELRGWTIYGEGGYSTVLKIPMKVSQKEDYVGKTVATVNTVRIWTNPDDMENISWVNGIYDESTEKNSVNGYVTVIPGSIEHYSGEVANGSAYEKTEYANGQVILGTNTGGYVYGSSLLILGYKAEVDITVDKEIATGANYPTYNLDNGQYRVNYRLCGIIARPSPQGTPQETKTDLTVTAKLDESYTSASGYESDKQRLAVSNGTYQMVSFDSIQLCDVDGKEINSVKISENASEPTTVKYYLLDAQGNKTRLYTIRIYAVRDTNGTKVDFHLADVTVGASVPEITFGAEISPTMVKNNDTITATAYVSGTSDIRAYSKVNGNMDSTTIGIIQLGATRLVKSVDTRYIELNGTITYTVTYTNSGSGELNTLYLNDLLPDTEDNRGSKYTGELELIGVNAYLSSSSEFSAKVEFYYSIEPYGTLREAVDLSNAENRDPEKIAEMLRKKFILLGTIESGEDTITYSDNFNQMTEEEKAQITGIYAVVTRLQGGNSINLVLETKSLNNTAGDGYQNVAYSWLAGSDSVELVSNQVETTVLSRTISGVVWYDKNLNGIRDNGELLIKGVTCTLFKKGENGKYEICTEDVTGAVIAPFSTGEDGVYRFDKLAAGDYIVAFSGDVLKQYTGVTTYQVTNGGEAVNSDAVAIEQLKADGIDTTGYVYAIRYSGKSPQVELHTIEKIVEGNLTLTNYVEQYANLDCGVIIAGPELPMTGGFGTTPYTIGGLLLTGAGLLLLYNKKKRRKEDFASS